MKVPTDSLITISRKRLSLARGRSLVAAISAIRDKKIYRRSMIGIEYDPANELFYLFAVGPKDRSYSQSIVQMAALYATIDKKRRLF